MRAVFGEDRETELTGDYLPLVGTFVEVGAYDARKLSQTWHLEQRGWDGLLIEPAPAHAERLRVGRRAKVIELACCAPANHGASMPLYLADGSTSLYVRNGPPVMVQTATLDSILEANSITTVDFLSVDVEEYEIEVLKGLSFDRHRPALILLEDHAFDSTRHRFMRSRQYKRVRRTGHNSWYVPDEAPFGVSWVGHLQILRKYYLARPIRRMKRRLQQVTNRTLPR